MWANMQTIPQLSIVASRQMSRLNKVEMNVRTKSECSPAEQFRLLNGAAITTVKTLEYKSAVGIFPCCILLLHFGLVDLQQINTVQQSSCPTQPREKKRKKA